MANPIICLKQGRLQGGCLTSYNGEKIYSFQGIPYAKPPIGKLRFKAPSQPEKWDGIWDATKERNGSYAKNWVTQEVNGDEDCLYLNVYTKEIPNAEIKTSPKPVMVYIHGGGFMLGPSSTLIYGPEFLLTEDVVLVVITYRLGLLGFIAFEESSLKVPGNAGFKDMVMALKWIQNNISQFGGDPNNVTVFGQSAGAGAVHLLMLSPMAKGLIHRVIAQSGSALNTWAPAKNCIKEIATLLGNEKLDEKTVYDKLIEIPVDELFEIQQKLIDDLNPWAIRPFGFTIETGSSDPFLTESPIDIIKNGTFHKIPFMTGYTTIDGIIVTEHRIGAQNLEMDLPYQLGLIPGGAETRKLAEKLKIFYFDEKQQLSEFRKTIIKNTDTMFLYFQYLAVKNQSMFSGSPTYLYRMSVDTGLNMYKVSQGIKEEGASHCDCIGYLFKNFTTPEIHPNSIEEISMKRFVKLWTNFAKYGNPTPNKNDELLNNVEWKPVIGEIINFLDIGSTLVPGINPEKERIDFWREIFAESPGKQYT